MNPFRSGRSVSVFVLSIGMAVLAGGGAMLGVCGPFTDVAGDAFCQFVLEIFYLGITTGTTPTTYDPAGTVNRLQMAAFLSRTVDGVVKRGSRRTALERLWTPQNSSALGLTSVAPIPNLIQSDGTDLWAAISTGVVVRVRGGDGKMLETWTGAGGAYAIRPAIGRILAASQTNPGNLYRIDPTLPAGGVTTVASTLGAFPSSLVFDGGQFWTANGAGSVSIVTPEVSIPWTVTTVTTGFSGPTGALFDGGSVWVTDFNAGKLFKLNAAGAILLTVTVGSGAAYPAFDGTNIWVPNYNAGSVSVVRASSGALLATLTSNGVANPRSAAFDGERILTTDVGGVSLWKAADLSPLGNFGVLGTPLGACSDGTFFWLTAAAPSTITRF